jgi:hypothetical protein
MHSTLTLLVGAGGAGYHEKRHYNEREGGGENWDAFFIVEPGLNAELNMTRFFRVDAGISYRFVSGVDQYALVDDDIAGPSINLTFKFGKF